tara:strand:- start:5158 stop:5409 length:252 start_codon:yes stop_codon:yes gene_type:complete
VYLVVPALDTSSMLYIVSGKTGNNNIIFKKGSLIRFIALFFGISGGIQAKSFNESTRSSAPFHARAALPHRKRLSQLRPGHIL